MKLIVAIVNRDDAGAVTQNLAKAGFSSTKLTSAGGFLLAVNYTLLVGVKDEKVSEAIEIIREYSHSRKQLVPTNTETGMNYIPNIPVEVTVGGATVFVLDVEQFERL